MYTFIIYGMHISAGQQRSGILDGAKKYNSKNEWLNGFE
jgi:hypothetical protein